MRSIYFNVGIVLTTEKQSGNGVIFAFFNITKHNRLKSNMMADNKSKKGKQDRSQVSGSENYEIQYFKEKMGVSSQAVTGAIRATKSNDRKILEKYLKDRHDK